MCHSVVAQRVCETCGCYMGEIVVDFEECARTCHSPFYCMTPIPHMEICTFCASTANCPPIRSIPLDSLHPINTNFNIKHDQQRRGSTSTCFSTTSSNTSSGTCPSSCTSAASSSSSSASHEPDDPLTTRGPVGGALSGCVPTMSATSATNASSRRGAARKASSVST